MLNNLRSLWSALDDEGNRHYLVDSSEFLHYEVSLAGGMCTFLFAKAAQVSELPGYAGYIAHASDLAIEKLNVIRPVDVLKTQGQITLCVDKAIVSGAVDAAYGIKEASGYQYNTGLIYPLEVDFPGDFSDPDNQIEVYKKAGENFIRVNGGQILSTIRVNPKLSMADLFSQLRPTLDPYEMYVLCGYGREEVHWAIKTQIGRNVLHKFAHYTGRALPWQQDAMDKTRCTFRLSNMGLSPSHTFYEPWEGTLTGEKYIWLNPIPALTGFELTFNVSDVVERDTAESFYIINNATYKARTTYEKMAAAGLFDGESSGSFIFIARSTPWSLEPSLVDEISAYKKLMELYNEECVEIEHPDTHKWIVPDRTFGDIKKIIADYGKLGYYLVSNERANQKTAGTDTVAEDDFPYKGYKFLYGSSSGDTVTKDGEYIVIQRNTLLWLQCYVYLPSTAFSWTSSGDGTIASYCHSPHPYFVYQDICEEYTSSSHQGAEQCCEWSVPMTDPQFSQWQKLLSQVKGTEGYLGDVGNTQSTRWEDMSAEGKVLSYMFAFKAGLVIPRLFLPVYKATEQD